jgi:hypothetical protein
MHTATIDNNEQYALTYEQRLTPDRAVDGKKWIQSQTL